MFDDTEENRYQRNIKSYIYTYIFKNSLAQKLDKFFLTCTRILSIVMLI